MNATKIEWNKVGDWAPNNGPTYWCDLPGVGRLLISGSWGTIGDNGRGWWKTKFYQATLHCDGVRTEIGDSTCLLKSSKRAVDKFLAKLPTVS
jgi:hypothetical protein